ncbi:hypothetical protein DKX38_006479 [Salix brachista]|uniref:Uncharacterized protein n=1 Tax=Salix brachista TaxID=2182728 RepID=A0A5N5N2P8_9ROSI|nr:hypothetical protein DKX38_006479 [Salix brachista]
MNQDSFTRCFKSNPPEPWNWNVYLFPLRCCGVVIRYWDFVPCQGSGADNWVDYFSFILHSSAFSVERARQTENKNREVFGGVNLHVLRCVMGWSCQVPSIRPKQKHPGWVACNACFLYLLLFDDVQGAFELDSTVCPIAIKYNKIFVDAFWKMRK